MLHVPWEQNTAQAVTILHRTGKQVRVSLSTSWRVEVQLRSFFASALHRDDQPQAPTALSPPGKYTPVPTEQKNCALLGYYAAKSGNFLPTFRDNLSGPVFKGHDAWWATDAVRDFWRRDMSLIPARGSNPKSFSLQTSTGDYAIPNKSMCTFATKTRGNFGTESSYLVLNLTQPVNFLMTITGPL
jgi:hypothetical protein